MSEVQTPAAAPETQSPAPAATTTETVTTAAPQEAAPATTILTDADQTTPAPTEGKPEGTQESKADETPATPAVPEKYELKLAEDSLLPKARVEQIEAYAKANGMTNEQAQALVDRESQAVDEFHTQQQEVLKAKAVEWVSDVKADKELGGEAFNQNVEAAKRALHRFGNDQLKSMLDQSGLGNHPEFVRVFARIGKAMADDSFVKPGAQAGKQVRAADVLFGSKDD